MRRRDGRRFEALPRCPALTRTPSRGLGSAAHSPTSSRRPADSGPSSGGFAALGHEFRVAVDRVAADTGLSARQVALDYWIVRILHALHLRLPPVGVLGQSSARRGGEPAGSPLVGVWAFSGGNSLLARRGHPDWARTFPELGGFELPCVQPWWTAINKLDDRYRFNPGTGLWVAALAQDLVPRKAARMGPVCALA